jgi:hypothetical protein
MTPQLSDEEIIKQARKRVEEKKGFFVHLITYVMVNIGLILIWAFAAGGGYPWFVWVLGGWGIGIVSHFLSVFVFNKTSGWERRQMDAEVERIKREQSPS